MPYGCKAKQIKERLMIPWTVRRMTATMSNQIMPKHSLETLAIISKLKYFGHTMHSSGSIKKRFDIRIDRWQGKIKTKYKMFSRNMRNPDYGLVQHLNCHTK
jgi:hypothetical protein